MLLISGAAEVHMMMGPPRRSSCDRARSFGRSRQAAQCTSSLVSLLCIRRSNRPRRSHIPCTAGREVARTSSRRELSSVAELGPWCGPGLCVDVLRRDQSKKSIGGGARRMRASGPVGEHSYLISQKPAIRRHPQSRGYIWERTGRRAGRRLWGGRPTWSPSVVREAEAKRR